MFMKLIPTRPSDFLDHLRRNVARYQLVAGRKDDGIALDAERPIEDDPAAVAIVALRILVGLDDADPSLAALRDWPGELDADVAAFETGIRQP